jgi:hypothetical protein
MKRNCADVDCGKRYVTSKAHQKYKADVAPYKGDEGLCDKCLADVCQIAYEQSYFGSIGEWGGLPPGCDGS